MAGSTPDETRQRWPEQVNHWYTHHELAHIPAGETLADLTDPGHANRERAGLPPRGETIVMVGHTVINRIILLRVTGSGERAFLASQAGYLRYKCI